jgi:hypothetical protein
MRSFRSQPSTSAGGWAADVTGALAMVNKLEMLKIS